MLTTVTSAFVHVSLKESVHYTNHSLLVNSICASLKSDTLEKH